MKLINSWFLIVAISVLLMSCSASDNLQKPAALVKFKPQIKTQKVWQQFIGANGGHYVDLHVAQANQAIYVTNQDGLVGAYSLQHGDIYWQKNLYDKIISGVAANNQLVVLSDSHGYLIALDAHTGKILWKHNVGEQVLAPAALSRNNVIVKTVNNDVFALRADNGKQIWHVVNDAPALMLRGGGQPQLNGSQAIIGLANGKLQSLSQASGAIKWQQVVAEAQGSFPVQRMVDITAAPQISDGVVYTVTYQGNIAALELDNGKVLWKHKLSSYTGLAVGKNNLFVSDAKGHVVAFSKDIGSVVWQQKKLQARVISPPALLSNYVIVADAQGYIHWLSQANGEFVARQRLSHAAIRTVPLVVNDMLYVLDTAGYLAAYRLPSSRNPR